MNKHDFENRGYKLQEPMMGEPFYGFVKTLGNDAEIFVCHRDDEAAYKRPPRDGEAVAICVDPDPHGNKPRSIIVVETIHGSVSDLLLGGVIDAVERYAGLH